MSAEDLPTDRYVDVRKRPVTVQARRVDEGPLFINTREGCVVAHEGDVVISGVEGELYPCDPDIFAETYEVVGGE